MTHDPDTPALPAIDVLLTGTFALMTTWASTSPQQRCACQRTGAELPLQSLIARKIVSNLFFLINHPQVGVEMARSLAKVHAQWRQLAQASEPPAPTAALNAETAPCGSLLH